LLTTILHSQINQHLARANFTADRGIRYGADTYAARMQATRRCRVPPSEPFVSPERPDGSTTASTLAFTVVKAEQETEQRDERKDEAGEGTEEEKERGENEDGEEREKNQARKDDPIRMFGILTPPALRLAQAEAIKMVETLVPRIITLDTAMKELEIQIRRARKQKAKAEAFEAKELQAKMQRIDIEARSG
jgi:hypothetical protein